MAILDRAGLFLGARLSRCSDAARLHWPYLYTAANGYGRLELNFDLILATVYVTFQEAPAAVHLIAWLSEYYQQRLLFIYQSDKGQWWGQFSTEARWLPRYKSGKDRLSPAPCETALCIRANSQVVDMEVFRKFSESFGKFRRGVGVGVGVGVALSLSLLFLV